MEIEPEIIQLEVEEAKFEDPSSATSIGMILIAGAGLMGFLMWMMLRRCAQETEDMKEDRKAYGSYARGNREESKDENEDIELTAKDTIENNF